MAPKGEPRNLTAKEVVHVLLGREVGGILKFDPIARLGDDPEGVHQLRVRSRRLRSELQIVAPVIKSTALQKLTSELGRIGKILGRLRDLDVQRQLLLDLSDDASMGSSYSLLAELDHQRHRERRHVADALDSRRYRRLIGTLTSAVLDPPFRSVAAQSAGDVFMPGLYDAWTLLFKTMDECGPSPTNDELHQIRILAKKSRYGTEIASSFLGTAADKIADALASAQSVLGTLHDDVMATTYLANEQSTHEEDADWTAPRAALSVMSDQLSASIEQCRRKWRAPLLQARGLIVALG
ncbi:MAG TPA: CHAD domain-containing protein [Acidimicrobiales bacterium]|nr:CHAD domain-containing protein [Acidimicrobiales bacterium]